MRTILVTGGHGYRDIARVFSVLDTARQFLGGPVQLRHGGARGADALAGQWATSRGVPCHVAVAQWSTGRSAGHRRNIEMAKAGADVLIAFPGGSRTTHMVETAHRHGIPIVFA